MKNYGKRVSRNGISAKLVMIAVLLRKLVVVLKGLIYIVMNC